MTKVAVVAGVGPGNGAALVRRFRAAGYEVAMLAKRRDALDALAAETRYYFYDTFFDLETR